MLNTFRPRLPDQVYDVQAEVRPIANTKLMWTFIMYVRRAGG